MPLAQISGRVLKADTKRELCSGGESEMFLFCGNAGLRAAIRQNRATFPSQIVRLRKREDGFGDEPERIVQLYFVRGWSVENICARYGFCRKKVSAILTKWRRLAVAAGFVQAVEPWTMSNALPVSDGVAQTVPSPTGPSDSEDAPDGETASVPYRRSPAFVPGAVVTPSHGVASYDLSK